MTKATARPDSLRVGDQTFHGWHDLEIASVKKQLEEIDPNLLLMKTERGGWAVLWNGHDANWHAVCINHSGSRAALLALPAVLRERDRNSPVNSRESAFERDMKEVRRREKAREEEMIEALTEQAERVYHGLRKDQGHQLGLTSKRYFTTRSSKTDSW